MWSCRRQMEAICNSRGALRGYFEENKKTLKTFDNKDATFVHSFK